MSSAQTSGVALGHGPAQPRVHSSTITVHTGLAPVHCRFARPSASTATSWVNIAISAAFRRPTEASQDNAFIAEVRIQSDPAYGHWRRQLSPQGRRSVFGPHGHPAAGPHYRLQTAAAIPGGRPNTCGGVPGFVGSRHRRDLPSSGKPVRTVLVGPSESGRDRTVISLGDGLTGLGQPARTWGRRRLSGRWRAGYHGVTEPVFDNVGAAAPPPTAPAHWYAAEQTVRTWLGAVDVAERTARTCRGAADVVGQRRALGFQPRRHRPGQTRRHRPGPTRRHRQPPDRACLAHTYRRRSGNWDEA